MTHRRNPFVGLRPFTIDDSLLFFGREEQTAGLLEILHHPPRFLGVVGSSGSGKSSLVRAGLLPALLGGFLAEDRDHWKIVQIKPGDEPIRNLATGLIDAFHDEDRPATHATLEQGIRDAQADAVLQFLHPLDDRTSVFILIDQFEEIFAFRRRGGIEGTGDADSELSVTGSYAVQGEADASAAPSSARASEVARERERARRRTEASDFVATILALAEQTELPVYVALTMRTDFLGDCDLFYGLPEALNRGQYLVPRLTRRQLQRAIEGPITLAGARISPRLLDHVLNELGDRSDRLPVLQHALQRTWDVWAAGAPEAGPIDLQHFTQAGGLTTALNNDAEEAARGVDARVAERLFRRLTSTDVSGRRVRSPARLSELITVAGAERGVVVEVIQHFAEHGRNFVYASADGRPDDPMIDISHESLIRQWTTLGKWVDQERQARDEYHELVQRARNWAQEMEKDPARKRLDAAAPSLAAGAGPDEWLLRNPELRRFSEWRTANAPSEAWAARYSARADDFHVAMHYLDVSEATRVRAMAEARVLRRWASTWRPWLTAVEVMSLITFVISVRLFSAHGGLGSLFVDRWIANIDWLPPSMTFPNPPSPSLLAVGLAQVLDVMVSLQFAGTVIVGATCLLLNYRLREWYRRRKLPRAMADVAAEESGRRPLPREASEVHRSQYASTGSRVAAGALDLVVVLVELAICVWVFTKLRIAGVASSVDVELAALIVALLFAAWRVLSAAQKLSSPQHATRGMKAVGTFATDLHGGRLTFARALAWSALRIVSIVPYGLGFLTQPFTARQQTVHDWVAGVVVLKRPRALLPAVDHEQRPD